MSIDQFTTRNCPSCGAAAAKPEVSSERRAEVMSLDQIRPYWSGLFQEKVFFSYDRCQSCGLLFAPTFFSLPQLESLYADMQPNMDVVAGDAIPLTQRGYFDTAAKAGPLDGAYLEIGADVGYIVDHAAREGNFDHFWLYEPNRSVHAQLAAATHGLPHDIITDMTDLSAVPDGSVGLAVMVHVLDHLLNPAEMLAQIRAKLRPGGTLMIVTHNEASLLRKVLGTRWPPFCLQHPEIYSPTSITRLVGGAGYQAVDVSASKNYFPFDFLVRQAAWMVGVKLGSVPLPKRPLGLRLGNIITTARA